MARSRSIRPALDGHPAVLIPLDRNRFGGVASRVKRATRWLWSRGIYPSPSAVNVRMRGWTRDCLNGIETKARNSVMAELKITRQRTDKRIAAMEDGK